jgi:DNA-binding NarL/FixJ family response regulator
LRAESDFAVVASCRDSTACLEAIRKLSPELAVLDAALPNQGALQVLTIIRSEQLGTQVIFLSESPDSSSTADLVSKGAYRVLSKETSLENLVRCVRDVPDGQKSEPKLLNGHDLSARSRTESPCDVLTERERQIMQLVREGLSNKDIGRQCNLSDGTVKVHLHHIYEKLAIRNRTALAVLATGDLHASVGNGEARDGPVAKPAPSISIAEAATRLRPKVD